MRYSLDTNILIYLLMGDRQDLSLETVGIIYDHSNQLYTTSISIIELIQLVKIGKIKHKKYKTIHDYLAAVKSMDIKILPFGEVHNNKMADLTITKDHNDPFDHAIISHAIIEKLTLVSSDTKFDYYAKTQHLNFHFNKR